MSYTYSRSTSPSFTLKGLVGYAFRPFIGPRAVEDEGRAFHNSDGGTLSLPPRRPYMTKKIVCYHRYPEAPMH
jgi:hypothetical protein